MNVKEQHVVTGMSRDSAVSQHNPNLVYDAHNIRITTKDGKNSLLSVTNEKGTKSLGLSANSVTIVGVPLGSAIIKNYLVLFTHDEDNLKDHIYRCELTEESSELKIQVVELFNGNADFDLEHPIETLPLFETELIQKVYWVDGKNQPRMINIVRDSAETNKDMLNFSREIALNHKAMNITKNNGGGVFSPGTIQYMYSYYDLNGQETALIDISPMYYLSPQDRGAKADSLVTCSFTIELEDLDTSFDFVRIYAVVRAQENGAPMARKLGDFPCKETIVVEDDGRLGSTVTASSLYFLGGEECIAGTLEQKDNTLFVGDITLTRPNLKDVDYGGDPLSKFQGTANLSNIVNEGVGTATVPGHFYDKRSTSATDYAPHSNNEFYDYTVDNNRSSYYIKRFKWGETYRLGFIAQYKNGQWSDPLWLGDKKQDAAPLLGQGSYRTGNFTATLPYGVVDALLAAGYRRVAPVVVYPQPNERTGVLQGILCPTLYTNKDRKDNAPYCQASWFFRWGNQMMPGNDNTDVALGLSSYPSGEIHCIQSYTSDEIAHWFRIDRQHVTINSPDIDCVDNAHSLDLVGTQLVPIGILNSIADNSTAVQRIVNHSITVESAGINTTFSRLIDISQNTPSASAIPLFATVSSKYCLFNYPLYCDSPVDNETTDEVRGELDYVAGWIVYPWHRSGSLNNQKPLSTKQKANGYESRTAMLKRNITANYWFTHINEFKKGTALNISTPTLFDADQLAAVRVSSYPDSTNKTKSYNYYGNIDKVVVSGAKEYYNYVGWACKAGDITNVNSIEKRSIEGINGLRSHVIRVNGEVIANEDDMAASDPVSMKYKSSPHIVVSLENNFDIGTGHTDPANPHFQLVALDKTASSFVETSTVNMYNFQWIRCGESEILKAKTPCKMTYLQGDCYVQRYDCLKTYAFTNEDTNSVIDVLSTMIETYVNLDFRTDGNRGNSNNVILSPQNFNLFNHPAYEQSGNFFTYKILDPNVTKNNRFPNVVAWSLEKKLGENVDTWLSIDLNNTIDLDGTMGNLTKLINYNNDVYAFQSTGFAQLLFNSRVQIPTSDGAPIEITNGMKMQGKRYLSNEVGCTNKWSIIKTPIGMYFNDDIMKATYLFNGQLSEISAPKGMKSWMNENCSTDVWDVKDYNNCRAFYDKAGRDIYWVYKDTALVYSEILNQYMSFMDYGSVPLIANLSTETLAITSSIKDKVEIGIRAAQSTEEGIITFSTRYNKDIILSVQCHEPNDSIEHDPIELTITEGSTTATMLIVINTANVSAPSAGYCTYNLQQILTDAETKLSSYMVVTFEGDIDYAQDIEPWTYSYVIGPMTLNAYVADASSFWRLGAGKYNEFFGQQKPYWITFISNSSPTVNKIYNNLEWRDIVNDDITMLPYTTFDHLQVWTEHQDTESVEFVNQLHVGNTEQPISYDAARSNLRKKFNVWRCQIPRDKLATNKRARISSPWAYIKLSRENMISANSINERHEFTDLVVDYFI